MDDTKYYPIFVKFNYKYTIWNIYFFPRVVVLYAYMCKLTGTVCQAVAKQSDIKTLK